MTITSTTDDTATDTQAVLDVLARAYGAWAIGDADAFVADYLEDATVVQPGIFKADREEIRATMAAGFAGPLKGSRGVDEAHRVRFVGPDTALVISEGGIILPGQDAVDPARRVRATWTLSRQDGRWMVAHYQNSPA